ncbi:MAG: DsbA family protein [Rhodovibrionaceae bacterium]
MNRRYILLSGAAAALTLATAPWALKGGIPAALAQELSAKVLEIDAEDRVLGEPDAPVTIIEYASTTCGHCASFHKDVLPTVKQDWIEEGRAKLVLRHFVLNQLDLRASMVARCMEGPRYFGFMDALFRSQSDWAVSDGEKALSTLQRLASTAGMDSSRFESCITDEAAANVILEKMAAARDAYDISSTPSFLINGQKVSGVLPLDEFIEVLKTAEQAASG